MVSVAAAVWPIVAAVSAGVMLALLVEQAGIMWGNRAAARKRRQRIHPLPPPSQAEPVWLLPTTPMPPAVSDDELEVYFGTVRQLFREDQARPVLPGPYGRLRALGSRQAPQPRGKHGRRAPTSGDAS
jgi:hypothetical protein